MTRSHGSGSRSPLLALLRSISRITHARGDPVPVPNLQNLVNGCVSFCSWQHVCSAAHAPIDAGASCICAALF